MKEVTLEEVLRAREERAACQSDMISRYNCPLISFSMNIAGPVKVSLLIRKAFSEGISWLDAALERENIEVKGRTFRDEATGCEAVYAVKADAERVKAICVAIEEGSELGRLFDIDVIGTDGLKLTRRAERRCLICGATGRGCASRRAHTVKELQDETREIMIRHFTGAEGERISEMVTGALREEVLTTPKPGLVDNNNTGSHRDMDIDTFQRSAEALRPFWKECFRTGQSTAGGSPEETFLLLRHAGICAESDMLEATGGVNTHKGAIFMIGTVCGAIGRLYDPEGCCPDPAKIAGECAAMTGDVMTRELRGIADKGADGDERDLSYGERIWIRYGLKGARGEIAEGLPGVIGTGLPTLKTLLREGFSRNDAGAAAIVALIARGTDTNMIRRGGYKAASDAALRAEEMVRSGAYTDMRLVRSMDDDFIERNLSPGGCADLLAITYFLHDYCHCGP